MDERDHKAMNEGLPNLTPQQRAELKYPKTDKDVLSGRLTINALRKGYIEGLADGAPQTL